jgi:hypothetical protein
MAGRGESPTLDRAQRFGGPLRGRWYGQGVRLTLILAIVALALASCHGAVASDGSVPDDSVLDAQMIGDGGVFPLDCGVVTFAFDTVPGISCAVTPADVACNVTADCTTFVPVTCHAIAPVYGWNASVTPGPCTANCPTTLIQDEAGAGVVAEDCNLVAGVSNVGVACVNNVCRTFALDEQ